MLTPSIGVWATPLTVFGSGMLAASSTVGAISTTCWNWLRTSPLALIRSGQLITSGLRVPPKLEATCLVHMKGVLPATAQPAAMCGKVSGPPHLSMFLSMSGTDLGDAVEVGHLVEHAVHAAFGAGAVVADVVDDQRVVELADVLDGLHDAADLVVGVRGEGGEHLHLPGEQPLLVGAAARPSP